MDIKSFCENYPKDNLDIRVLREDGASLLEEIAKTDRKISRNISETVLCFLWKRATDYNKKVLMMNRYPFLADTNDMYSVYEKTGDTKVYELLSGEELPRYIIYDFENIKGNLEVSEIEVYDLDIFTIFVCSFDSAYIKYEIRYKDTLETMGMNKNTVIETMSDFLKSKVLYGIDFVFEINSKEYDDTIILYLRE